MKVIYIIGYVFIGLLVGSCAKDKENIVDKVEVVPAESGSLMLTGSGKPVSSLGKVGDFYIDLSNSELYGAKTQAGWGAPISLKGTDGQNGARGSVLHTGNTPPDSQLGEIGDWYIDTQNKHIYGPKTNAGWGVPVINF